MCFCSLLAWALRRRFNLCLLFCLEDRREEPSCSTLLSDSIWEDEVSVEDTETEGDDDAEELLSDDASEEE